MGSVICSGQQEYITRTIVFVMIDDANEGRIDYSEQLREEAIFEAQIAAAVEEIVDRFAPWPSETSTRMERLLYSSQRSEVCRIIRRVAVCDL